jgi:DNA-binding transcriptional LysR family regulator
MGTHAIIHRSPTSPTAMRDLNDVQYFAAVVEHHGFSAAARALNLPKSSVTRHIADLEARLGVRLLERSTRSVRCTEVGEAFYEQCRAILGDFDAAESAVAVQRAEPIGLVRVSCPTGLSQFGLAKILPKFLSLYPKVRLQVLATNRAIDLVEDNVDIAIRARVRMADEATTMRMLYRSELIFVASPAFSKAHQNFPNVEMISSLPFLSFLEDVRRPTWTLIGPKDATKTLSFDPILISGDLNVLLKVAAAGLGIALLPSDAVEDELRAKRLIQILSDWHSEEVNIHLVFATKRGLVPAVRVLIDYLGEHFKFRPNNALRSKEVETIAPGNPNSRPPRQHSSPI